MTALFAIDRDWSRRLGVGRAPEASLPAAGSSTFLLPDGIDYFVWRLLLSDKLKGPRDLIELDDRWTYPDMLDAHAMLDAIEDAISKETAKHEAEMRSAKRGGR